MSWEFWAKQRAETHTYKTHVANPTNAPKVLQTVDT